MNEKLFNLSIAIIMGMVVVFMFTAATLIYKHNVLETQLKYEVQMERAKRGLYDTHIH